MRYALSLSLAIAIGLTGVASAGPTAQITVYAAASLTEVFPRIDSRQRFSFAASNTLAQQIRQGAPADVFASADTSQPAGAVQRRPVRQAERLRDEQARRRPSESNPGNVKTVFDLRRPGVKIVIARAGRACRQLHAADPPQSRHHAPPCCRTSSARSRTCGACSRRWRSARPMPASSIAQMRRR